uniref:Reverse transcriptase domain-containing protein n=1 Tax=Tanacetum cinerariifolium TaxID=118510 RepID=A0A6L2JP21_TANCI|nr:reverse transcriptase domain-containing protein [Tanacetum cinerariifolium]
MVHSHWMKCEEPNQEKAQRIEEFVLFPLAPTEGYGEAIVILKILAENFEIKKNLLQLVQANKFHGRETDNSHTHIRNFKRMTATLKYRDVPNDAIKLMLFPYSLEDRARICEDWDRFKEFLRACPHHGFSELTQIDTFYNGLTEQDQDSLNAASGGNLLNKTTREALQIIENKSRVCYSRSKSNVSRVNTNSRDVVSKTDDKIDKLADQISNLVEIVNKQVIAPAKVVKKTCVTCGGAHAYYECIATDSNPSSVCVATGSYNQVSSPNRASHQIPPPGFASVQINPNRFNQAKVSLNENCSAMLLKKLPEKLGDPGMFLIPCDFLGMEVCHTLADLGASINLMPLSIWKKLSLPELTPTRMTLELADRSITHPKGVAEDVFVMVVKFHFPTDFIGVDFEANLRVPLILGRSFLRTIHALIDVYERKLPSGVDVIDIACEDFVQDVLDFQYNPKSSNPTLVYDDLISESDACRVPIVKSSSLILTSFGESDFFLEEIEDFLNDDSIPIENSGFDLEGDILLVENLLNEEPCQLPPMDLKVAEESKDKSSIEEPPELKLKELPYHLEYAFLEDLNKLPVIIAKNLKVDEREALINFLKSHKWVISWKISDIKGIHSRFCTHKILMEDDYKPAVQSQRRVNPKIHDVIKKEFICNAPLRKEDITS